VEYNSESLGEWFEIMSTITPELCDMKSYYQLIVSCTKAGDMGHIWPKYGKNMGW